MSGVNEINFILILPNVLQWHTRLKEPVVTSYMMNTEILKKNADIKDLDVTYHLLFV